ncbi:MAG: outer membrane lipoprotein-sorting protein [Oleiphilus sp.]|nr:MAG: outer membrane lipoprotein-sorting protein [Oleiphilus sp.]
MVINIKKNLMIFLLVMQASFVNTALAVNSADKGLSIIQEADLRDSGWNDSSSNITMVLRNHSGEESHRRLNVKNKEVFGDGDRMLTVFNEPKDVRGTALLTYSHKLDPDDQWLFLPSLKRVKRISSKNKSGPFMGSEFSFEDLSSQEIEKYTYKYIGDDDLDGELCFVIERYPVDKNSGYTFHKVWIDKQEYRTLKVDFYDRKGDLLKTLKSTNFKKHLNKYWRAEQMVMNNHQNGKSTELIWSNFRFNEGLKDSDLSKNSLKRAR